MARTKKEKYKDTITVVMDEGNRAKLNKALDALGVGRSVGIRAILVAFYENRCKITPPDKDTTGLDNLYK